ncbi:hypothetical protein [Mesorhizobium sp. 128a]
MINPALFVGEVRVVVDDSMVHIVGFATADGGQRSERHAVGHFVMSNEVFRKLLADGRSSLAKGGH